MRTKYRLGVSTPEELLPISCLTDAEGELGSAQQVPYRRPHDPTESNFRRAGPHFAEAGG